jgi:acetyl-CoA carboxylase carboxyl transferase subunit alpha
MEYDLAFEKPLQALAIQDPLHPEQRCEEALQAQIREIYAHLNAWQTVQVARHKNRPRTTDYIRFMCDDFLELHGDRTFGDDTALIGGMATFHDRTVMVLGHQRTRDRNFGMPHPEGYRKAYRLMQMAGKFGFPVICLIDTPGAFPGLADEERGQGQAIASNLALMATLPVPIIAIVIGEGGSGGALAIGVADRIFMLEHSIYSVAAPEAAASILWRDNAFAPQAAEAMRISAREVLTTHIVDGLIPEPVGGAHRNPEMVASSLRTVLNEQLQELTRYSPEKLIEMRYQKFRTIGCFKQAIC